MLRFKQFIEKQESDPCLQEQLQIRHGGWISEYYANKLWEEAKLSGPGQRSERVSASQEAKYADKMKPILQHFHDTYGPADEKPASTSQMADEIKQRFKHLDDLKANDPAEYKATMARATKKLTMQNGSTLGHPVAANAKTDTVNQIPGKDAPKGHVPVSMAFTPDIARHYTGTNTNEFVERNVCSGSSQGCRTACLAKTGNYAFTGNKALMDARTQRLTHNANARQHHADLVHGALTKATKDAENDGKGIIVRTAVSDDVGPEIHDSAIAQSFPQAKRMRYTKKVPSKEHNSEGQHQHTWSDTGPMVQRSTSKDGTVTKTINNENLTRRSLDSKVSSHPRYMVFNQHRGSEDSGKNIDHLKRVRKYEPYASQPEEGEKDEYHHSDGHGRVAHTGADGVRRSFRYQDHSVVHNATTTDGKSLRPYEHDARIPEVDKPQESLRDRNGKKVGGIVPSLSVKSTPKKELEDSGFFHHVENIDHNGIYHDGHPAEMEEAGHNPERKPTGQPVVTPTGKK